MNINMCSIINLRQAVFSDWNFPARISAELLKHHEKNSPVEEQKQQHSSHWI